MNEFVYVYVSVWVYGTEKTFVHAIKIAVKEKEMCRKKIIITSESLYMQ